MCCLRSTLHGFLHSENIVNITVVEIQLINYIQILLYYT